MDIIFQGLLVVISPIAIVVIITGVFVGIIVGVVPGIGAGVGLSLLLPFIFNMPPEYGLMLLLAIWVADGYGASICSILLNVPGGPGAVATCFDGYPMSQQGKGGDAIGLSMAASLAAGIIGAIILMLFAPPLAKFAVKVGPAEYTIMGVLGLTLVSTLSSNKPLKGMIAAVLGLTIAFMGYAVVTGFVRYAFGTYYLEDGINLLLVILGLYAVGSLIHAGQKGGMISRLGDTTGSVIKGFKAAFKYPAAIMRSSFIGVILGVMPGLGVALASLFAYDVEKKFSETPDQFGKGMPEGVIAPEAANNSVQPAALIPTLTLGIPGSASAAIFLGGLMIYGIRPGPSLFETNGALVWALMWALIIASIGFVIVGMLFADFFARVTAVPVEYLIPITLVTCFIGAYTQNSSYGDLVAIFILGVVGFLMIVLEYPIAPAIIGYVLAPMLEENYFQSLLISDGSYQIFFDSPIAIVLWIMLILIIAYPFVSRKLSGMKGTSSNS